jgi:methionyl aminopeptidase
MANKFIKSEDEIRLLNEGGKILRQILVDLAGMAKPGVSTATLNAYAESQILKAGGRPSFIDYGPKNNTFPAGLCTSINDIVVHGIPSAEEILKDGDIIGLDIGMEYKKLFTDTAITARVGTVSPTADKLVSITEQCLQAAIKVAVAGNRIGDIGQAIQTLAEGAGFSVVRDLVGHGVGYAVHEDPMVPGYGKAGTGLKLETGMVLAIEPMICEKDYHVYVEEDGWTIRTEDGGLSAHFEHTIAVGEKSARVLT